MVAIRQSTLRLLLILGTLTVILAIVSQLINQEQPQPYMDEIFHIPQVQQYCLHNFSHWDNMITTLPGLEVDLHYNQRYISSLLWTEPVRFFFGVDLCLVHFLRSQNIAFTLGCYVLLLKLFKLLHPQAHPSFLSPLSLIFFPLLFFFSFLYYTDNGSTLLVLTGYWLALKHHHTSSALALLCAIFFRQTNIIWAGFVGGTVGLQILTPHLKKGSALTQFLSLLSAIPSSLSMLLHALWPYALLGTGFILFVYINGGIVVGDRSHHVASLHLPQFLYFTCFSCIFSVGLILPLLPTLLFDLVKPKQLGAFIVLTVGSLFAVRYYTYEHPYLLADNRHYTFYVWKNIFKSSPHTKYLLTPLYSLSIVVMATLLAKKQSMMWVFLFLSCCLLSLVPQVLLEFRYYVIPYLLFRLHSKPIPMWGNVLELFQHNLINVITIWLFLKRPFKWAGHEECQRFMW